jgi:hypothetical protein
MGSTLVDHRFDFFSIRRINVLITSHLSVVLTVNLSKDVASICSSSFDFTALFHLETLNCAFYAFHFRHMLTPC